MKLFVVFLLASMAEGQMQSWDALVDRFFDQAESILYRIRSLAASDCSEGREL